jgi:uncharacterized protein (TIGR02001 family)
MKKIAYSALPALALLAGAAQAESPFSANAAFTTDYVFRGISQTLEEPAVQAGFDFAHDSGLYASIWGSNVNFADGDQAHVEIDYIAGYASTLGELGYDLGAIYYSYPGADSALDYDFFEAFGALSYEFGPVSLAGGLNYSPEFFGDTGSATYVYVGASAPLAGIFSVSATVGRHDIDAADDYLHWQLGVGAELSGFAFDLSYHDTDLDGGGDIADSRLVATVSRSF